MRYEVFEKKTTKEREDGMGFELLKATTLVQRAIMSAPGGTGNTYNRARALVKKSNCRSLYRLKSMNFSKFTPQQNIYLATRLLTRSSRWLAGMKNRVPTIGNYLELRFFVDSFMKIAKDSGVLFLFNSYASNIYLPKNATARQIKRAIGLLKVELKKAKGALPSTFASSLNQLTRILDILAKSSYVAQGWSWLMASKTFIKTNLSYCK